MSAPLIYNRVYNSLRVCLSFFQFVRKQLQRQNDAFDPICSEGDNGLIKNLFF